MDGKRRIAHAETRRSPECDIRNSPLWAEMVSHYEEEEAERLMKKFRVEIR